MLIVLSPVVCVLLLLVHVKLGGPVLFLPPRSGRHGRIFVIYKLRTMNDARDATGAHLPDAGRITRFGRLLRTPSLDEIPELRNVLKRNISLVGPRPLLPEYLPLYSPDQARRHQVRPGITGWAQVNGRNALSWEEKVRLDVWYVDNYSLALDLWILLRTVLKIIRREGISADSHVSMHEFRGSST